MTVSTEEIITGCKKGDSRAREALYDRYSARVLALCRRYIDSPETARDLMHDSFLVIFSEIKTLRDSARLEAWMFTIVKHLAIDYYRRKKKEVESIPGMELDELPADAVDNVPSYAELLKMIDDLPERYGQVFKLSALQGLNHKEIATILDIAEHTSSSDLYRARIMLKKAILKYWMVIPAVLFIIFLLFSRNKGATIESPLVSKNTEEPRLVVAPADSIAEIVETIEEIEESVPESPEEPVPESPEETLPETVEEEVPVTSETTKETHPDTFKKARQKEPALPVRVKKAAPKIYLTGTLPFGKSVFPADFTIDQGYVPIVGTWGEYKVYLDGRIAGGNADARTLSLYNIAKYNASAQESSTHSKREFGFPVSIGIKADFPIHNRMYLRTGLEYIRLNSVQKTGIPKAYIQENQRIHYLGIPAGLTFDLWNTNKLDITTSADFMLELPLKGTNVEKHVLNNVETYRERTSFRAPVQLSTGVGLGFQYKLYNNIGIYAEPRLRYYFNTGGNVETIRTEQPLQFNLSVGIKLGF